MNSLVKNCIFSFLIIGCLAACGEKKVKESAAESEVTRSILRSADEAATNLAKMGRHDKQYYLDRMAEIMTKCTKGSDIDINCFKSGLDGLLRE